MGVYASHICPIFSNKQLICLRLCMLYSVNLKGSKSFITKYRSDKNCILSWFWTDNVK